MSKSYKLRERLLGLPEGTLMRLLFADSIVICMEETRTASGVVTGRRLLRIPFKSVAQHSTIPLEGWSEPQPIIIRHNVELNFSAGYIVYRRFCDYTNQEETVLQEEMRCSFSAFGRTWGLDEEDFNVKN